MFGGRSFDIRLFNRVSAWERRHPCRLRHSGGRWASLKGAMIAARVGGPRASRAPPGRTRCRTIHPGVHLAMLESPPATFLRPAGARRLVRVSFIPQVSPITAPEGSEKVAGGEARHERNHRIPAPSCIRPEGAGEASDPIHRLTADSKSAGSLRSPPRSDARHDPKGARPTRRRHPRDGRCGRARRRRLFFPKEHGAAGCCR